MGWLTDIESFFGFSPQKNQAQAPSIFPTAASLISTEAYKLIVDAEGIDQPGQFPGGDSGITIGFGDDLGYQTLAQFTINWKDKLSPSDFTRLTAAIGMKGSKAAAIAHLFKDITIKRSDAEDVFKTHTIPVTYQLTLKTYPGLLKLCKNGQGALVSLIYNRGSDLTGDRRSEMAKIKIILDKAPNTADKDTYKAVAAQFRSMKRLWQGQGLDGLITRRENEAKLVETCIS